MNYYDDTLKKIDQLIEDEKNSEAYALLQEELSMDYIPKEFEEAFRDRLNKILENINKPTKTLSDEEIFEYLKKDAGKQIIAVSALVKKNLRDYIDVINDYLISKGFVNAKVFLIDSLIRQELSETFNYKNDDIEYTFIPKYLLVPEGTDGFLEASKLLNEYYLKEPSKLQLAMDLLYKEVIMMLPINPEKQEGELLFKKVTEYIDQAFACK